MLHGAQSCVFFILHSINRGKIPLLEAVKDVVDGYQMDVAVLVGNIQHANTLVHNLCLFLQ